jgi:hypothetical protein
VTERHSASGLTGRPVEQNSAEAKRRERAGIRGRPGVTALIWREPPANGLPFKPYVYRGLGYDQLTGEVVL